MQEKFKIDINNKKNTNFSLNKAYRVIIDTEHAGRRIDNFLLGELATVPKSRIYRMLRKGEVRINGGRIKAEYKLVAGDQVRIPPVSICIKNKQPPNNKLNKILDSIVYEDKKLIVLNKPSGIAVHGGSGINFGVIELLRHSRSDLKELGLVHRLDRETSGCLVIAKRHSVLRKLHENFRQGRVEKNYIALVVGSWQLGEQLIDLPLHVSNRKDGERHVIVNSKLGKKAQTKISLSREYNNYSLLRCAPITGRTHQIRVHLEHIKFPILGDQRYGDFNENINVKKKLGLDRIFLHAQSISFLDDRGGDLHFTAPLSEDLERFLQSIKLKAKKNQKKNRKY
ncbi:MAG: 23S rRNA pseudouridine(955/2504/2580) synthase [Gammaproteobacteria bacterium]|nr:23S rRNA pseudouridine(955/2504/2580) synthase [Gammaproteobacteria bacterium]|tara:strand:+ start:485 stop:1504 length:1020 start_codon:yes stop_codon:yes gene_type:complete